MKWLKFFRDKSGLSLNKLADLVGVQMNTVWRWESGRATPSAEMVRNLANALGVSETKLLNGPVSENWEIRIKLSKEGVIDVSEVIPSAEISIGDNGIAVTLSGSYELWADDVKFDGFLEQLKSKRVSALKFYQENF